MTEKKPPPALETELEIKRAEFHLKEDVLKHTQNSGAKSWRGTILVPVIIASIAAIANAAGIVYKTTTTSNISMAELDFSRKRLDQENEIIESQRDLDNERVKTSGENKLFEREHAKILATMSLSRLERKTTLCTYHHANIFQHNRSIGLIANAIASDPYCTEKGYIVPVPLTVAAENTELETCKAKATPVTSSCRAYDKSGFHSKPSATCKLNLSAGTGRFFAHKKVTVISEFYRNQSGQSALNVMKPTLLNGAIRSFTGTIGCTNSRGTGRTCETKATVRAISYPNECLSLLAEL